MSKYHRIFVIVLDSLGVGRMADSDTFGDYDVDTLGHIARDADHLAIPNLQRWGLANLHPLSRIPPCETSVSSSTGAASNTLLIQSKTESVNSLSTQ